MRGDLVSRPVGEVMQEAENLVKAGVKDWLLSRGHQKVHPMRRPSRFESSPDRGGDARCTSAEELPRARRRIAASGAV